MELETDEIRISEIKKALSSLEHHTLILREQLRQLQHHKEDRRCNVEIYWNIEQQMYITKFSRDEATLYLDETKKYRRADASIGIESVDGKPPRIPWKQIESGIPWQANVIVKQYYWEQHFANKQVPAAKVLYLEAYRH